MKLLLSSLFAGIALAYDIDVFFDPATIPDLEWIYVEGGEWTIGVDATSKFAHDLEQGGYNYPRHHVWVDGFLMGKTEVTNAQYLVFMNQMNDAGLIGHQWYESQTTELAGMEAVATDGPFKGRPLLLYEGQSPKEDPVNQCYVRYDEILDEFYLSDETKANWPVVYVRWYGAAAFAYYYGLSLPSDAQWEKAACGMNKIHNYATESGDASIEEANYDDSIGWPLPVCSYPENPLGFCDMAGNVWEWVQDWYRGDYWSCGPYDNPWGPEGDESAFDDPDYRDVYDGHLFDTVSKDTRGGAYNYHEATIACSYRRAEMPFRGNDHFGFRVVDNMGLKPEIYTPAECVDLELPSLEDYYAGNVEMASRGHTGSKRNPAGAKLDSTTRAVNKASMTGESIVGAQDADLDTQDATFLTQADRAEARAADEREKDAAFM